MDKFIIDFFTELGISESWAVFYAMIILIAGIILFSILVDIITRKILLSVVTRVIKKTRTKWDDALLKTGLFSRLAQIVPIILLYFMFPVIFQRADSAEEFIQRIIIAYLTAVIVSILFSLLTAVNSIYSTYEISKNRPIKGYLQIVKVFLVIIGTVLIISIILNQSVIGLLTGIGAMSAVLMLVFKDSILGLVAAVQLSGNDMIRIGDWVSIPAHGADGDVIDIKLQTVSIQNFDKTIVNVPIYSLVSSSFKNWRGMSESDGRRIKRHINIDINSVKFCSDELIARLKEIKLLEDYIKERQKEIDEHNTVKKINTNQLINGRRMTNLGVFRKYIGNYLNDNPMINKNMTFLIRQLQPTDKGIPLEIYVFSKDKIWANYEEIQADIFDHILASVSTFELAVYQSPSGLDFRQIVRIE
ncbi:MAG: mechanosensitive ion channel [Spirochaetales bacterium]|uniref:Mechanosensitive ion channel n=1 Tax=Candidatus Thalassospirochaeta sargassi TaxID=3119039 RepID=A0AAJ1IDK0_9SPIO|nr:mechanosensitive ion channel [Spirochaetales bacterium]